MAKAESNPTRKYVLLGDHIGRDGLLKAGSTIELTDEGAKNLVGKVQLKGSAKGVDGSDPKALATANARIEALDTDVANLTTERDALAAELEAVKAQNSEFRVALEIPEDEAPEGVASKLANWLSGKGKGK